MANVLKVLNLLSISAQKGYTIRTSVRMGKDNIRALKKEGFSITERKDPNERHGLFICTIDWTNPTVPGGKAEELLKISKGCQISHK